MVQWLQYIVRSLCLSYRMRTWLSWLCLGARWKSDNLKADNRTSRAGSTWGTINSEWLLKQCKFAFHRKMISRTKTIASIALLSATQSSEHKYFAFCPNDGSPPKYPWSLYIWAPLMILPYLKVTTCPVNSFSMAIFCQTLPPYIVPFRTWLSQNLPQYWTDTGESLHHQWQCLGQRRRHPRRSYDRRPKKQEYLYLAAVR